MKKKAINMTTREKRQKSTHDGGGLPMLVRGQEMEKYQMEEMERIKRYLASCKIEISSKTLERGCVVPRDIDAQDKRYPKIIDTLMHNPFAE